MTTLAKARPAAQAPKTHIEISVEDYFAMEMNSPKRHEFVDGVVYAMTGARDRHNLVSGDIFAKLLAHLPRRCQVFMTDMKLRLKIETKTRIYYPDVMVSCSETDRDEYVREQPVFIAEVLSPTTERTDRGEKFEAYKRIDSLEDYLIAHQDIARIELFRRKTGWEREVFSAGQSFTLPSVDLAFAVDDIYRRVEF
jgi:Uma2 family endonuclease